MKKQRTPRELRGTAAGALGGLVRQHKREREHWGYSHWHGMDAIRFPEHSSDFARGLPELIREDILVGHVPTEPLLDSGDMVVTMGSCFARELRRYLDEIGFASGNFWIPSGLNNTFALLDFVSWCATGSDSGSGFRYDREGLGKIKEWTPEGRREDYEAKLAAAGAFVFTLGLSEVWQDKETGGVFWRGVPEEIFDAGRHVFRLSTVEENEQNLLDLIAVVRKVNPDAPIILTLSPIPLMATFSGHSCVSADAVSKSVLRVAIDLVERRELPNVWYWPSFEVVRWAGAHLPYAAYGIPDRRSRHPSQYLVAEIIEAFVETFYTPEAVAQMRARGGIKEPAPLSLRGRAVTAVFPAKKKLAAEYVKFRKSDRGKAVLRAPRKLRRRLLAAVARD